MDRGERAYYYGLDILRFLAALIVMLFHVGVACWGSPTSGGAPVLRGAYTFPALAPYMWFGWIGVEIFFVISGFVIANSAEGSTPWKFVTSRVLRLYPGAWVCATATAIYLLSIGLIDSPGRYVGSMLLIPWGPFIDGQYWTLGVEIVFYLAVLALLIIGRYRWINGAAVLLAFYSLTYHCAALAWPKLDALSRGPWRLLLASYGSYFALGIIIRTGTSKGMTRLLWAGAAMSLLGAVLEIRQHTIGMSGRATTLPFVLADRWPVALAAFLTATLFITLSAIYWRKLLGLPAWAREGLRNAGLATYPLYLLHFSLGIGLTRELVLAGLDVAPALAIAVVVMTIAAVLVSRLFEPMIRTVLKPLLAALGTGTRRLADRPA